jgi:hypothetical protein
MAYKNEVSQSVDPMSRLNTVDKNRFIVSNASHPQNLSRYHGGHRRDNHPFISGYWYFLINPPERLFGSKGANNLESVQNWMFSTAESFTPPQRSLTKIDVPGMGGMASSYVAGQEITRSFTVTFREYQELPILSALQTWTSVIDPNTGTSPLAGDEYIPANYKGSAYAALCKPTVGTRESRTSTNLSLADIEQLFYFDGVFPTTAPYDSLSADINTMDGATISAEFSFDGYPLLKDSAGVTDTFLKLVNDMYIADTYEHYRGNITSATTADTRGGE